MPTMKKSTNPMRNAAKPMPTACVERERSVEATNARPTRACPCSQKVSRTTPKSFLRKILNWKMHPKA
jgi:hypothetical protein